MVNRLPLVFFRLLTLVTRKLSYDLQYRRPPSVPLQTRLPLQFVIVGGGISGLACAIGLRRVGHNVLVLESEADISHVRRTVTPSYCLWLMFNSVSGRRLLWWDENASKYDQDLPYARLSLPFLRTTLTFTCF